MEEEKKVECCENKMMSHKHGKCCCGHKAIKALVLALIIFTVFSLGVLVGSRSGRDFDGRGYGAREFNNSRMMRGYNNDSQNGNGGCRFQEADVQAPVSATPGCPMQAQIQTQVVSPTPVKTVTPVK